VAIFKSAIVLKGGEVVSLTTSDSHEDIIEYLGLKDEGKERTWCRVEFAPTTVKDLWNVDKYKLRLDETHIEELEWYEDIKETVLERMKVLATRQLITTQVRRLGYGIFYLGKGAEVSNVDHCLIPVMKNAHVTCKLANSRILQATDSSIYNAENCCFEVVDKTKINALNQCFVHKLQAGSGVGRATRSYFTEVATGAQIDNFDMQGYGSYLGTLSGRVLASGGNSVIWLLGTKAKHTGSAWTSQQMCALEAKNTALDAHIVELGAEIVKLGGKKPRKPRATKVVAPLTGAAKFGLKEGDNVGSMSPYPICSVCKLDWSQHSGWACRNPLTRVFDIP